MIKIDLLEFSNVRGLNLIKVTSNTSIKDADLLLCWHGYVLSLLKKIQYQTNRASQQVD